MNGVEDILGHVWSRLEDLGTGFIAFDGKRDSTSRSRRQKVDRSPLDRLCELAKRLLVSST